MDLQIERLFVFFGILGAIAGVCGAVGLLALWKLIEAHWH